MIIIPIKWLFHWEYTLFSDKPMSFYVILCDQHGRQLTRLPGVAVLGAGATSPGAVERSQAMLVGQWAFSGAVSGGRDPLRSPKGQWISPTVNESWRFGEGFVLETEETDILSRILHAYICIHKDDTIAPEIRGPGPAGRPACQAIGAQLQIFGWQVKDELPEIWQQVETRHSAAPGLELKSATLIVWGQHS